MICPVCSKAMEYETTCAACWEVVHYRCAVIKNGLWFCLNCVAHYPDNLEQAKINVAHQHKVELPEQKGEI